MSIYEYWDDDHAGGFIGLRVAVFVKKEHRQHYYAFRGKQGKYLPQGEIEYLTQCARDLEKQWMEEQASFLQQKARDCKEVRIGSMYTTGVRGVKMKFNIDKKHRAGELRCYYTPVFDVYGSTNNKRFFKKFNILSLHFSLAWQRAVTFYAEHKGIVNIEPLLNREPPVEKFMIIYRELSDSGHNIPKNRLPRELWGKKEVWDYVTDVKFGNV